MAGLATQDEKRRWLEDDPRFQKQLERIDAQVRAISRHPKVRNGYAFQARHSLDRGLWGHVKPYRWISNYVWIIDKDANLVLLQPNYGQLRLEAMWQWFEKRRLPVRIVILKARQVGFSTYIQARFFQDVIRGKDRSALLIAQKKEIGWEISNKFHRMLSELRRHPRHRESWEFHVKRQSRDGIEFGEPIHGGIVVASGEEQQPGHGITKQMMHLSEHPRWPASNAAELERKTSGLLMGLPDHPGTVCVFESTANGDTGLFRDMFWQGWRSWKKNRRPHVSGYRSLFIPWWIHGEYRWTRCWGGTEYNVPGAIPDHLQEEIEDTLDEEEAALVRRFGCDTDQLAWRRKILESKCSGDINTFHEQFPASPEEAFLATGRPAFDMNAVHAARARASELTDYERGTIADMSGEEQSLIQRELSFAREEF